MGGVICYRGEESRAGGEVRLELGRKGIRGGWGEGLRGMGSGLAGDGERACGGAVRRRPRSWNREHVWDALDHALWSE